MKVSELITRLQNFDQDEEVLVLGRETDWGYDGESSYEITDIEWLSVEGLERTNKGVCVYADRGDL